LNETGEEGPAALTGDSAANLESKQLTKELKRITKVNIFNFYLFFIILKIFSAS